MAYLIFMLKSVMVLCSFFLMVGCVFSQTTQKDKVDNDCSKWQSHIVPSINSSGEADLSQDVLKGIECMLKLKGNTALSKYATATTGLDIGTRLPPPTIEVAALYFVSYIYYQKWNHARGIALYENGKKNKKSTIKKAHKAYQSWFEKVKEIGLEEARKQKLDPLEGSGVNWY